MEKKSDERTRAFPMVSPREFDWKWKKLRVSTAGRKTRGNVNENLNGRAYERRRESLPDR